MKTIIIVLMMVLLSLPIILATDLSIAPVELKLSGNTGQNICGQINIYSKNYSGFILFQDRWAVVNFTNRILGAHNKTAENLGIYFRHENNFYIDDKKLIEVCMNAENSGVFHAALLFRQENSSFGIVSWMLLNITKNNVVREKETSIITGQVIKEENMVVGSYYFLIVEIVVLILLLLFLIKINIKLQDKQT